MVIKPSIGLSNYYIYAILFVAVHNAITNIVVSKYSSNATTYGYTLYYFLCSTVTSTAMQNAPAQMWSCELGCGLEWTAVCWSTAGL